MDLDFRKAPALLSTIVDEMPVGVLTVDSAGRVVSWSEGALRHTRYPHILAIGNASSLPTSKTSAAIRKQAPTLVANLLATLKNQPLPASCTTATPPAPWSLVTKA